MTRLLATLLLLPIVATAQTREDQRYCSLLGSVYETAAQMRDINLGPLDALKAVKVYLQYGPDLETQKRIINTVYFNKDFVYARGYKLRNQMVDYCLNGPKPWERLK